MRIAPIPTATPTVNEETSQASAAQKKGPSIPKPWQAALPVSVRGRTDTCCLRVLIHSTGEANRAPLFSGRLSGTAPSSSALLAVLQLHPLTPYRLDGNNLHVKTTCAGAEWDVTPQAPRGLQGYCFPGDNGYLSVPPQQAQLRIVSVTLY